jgi:hypothetical protein
VVVAAQKRAEDEEVIAHQGTITMFVIASEAKQSSYAPAGAKKR